MNFRLLALLVIVSLSGCASFDKEPGGDINNLPPTAAGTDDSMYMQTWTNLGGKAVRNLTRNAKYPSSFSSETAITQIDFSAQEGDKYGRRIYGLIGVAETGAYKFRLSADESAELWLATDEFPVNKRLIAFTNRPTGYQVWDRYGSQQSAAINLEAGKQYFIEVLHKENTGEDYLSVEWSVDGGAYAVISDQYVVAYSPSAPENVVAEVDEVALYQSAYHVGYTTGMNLLTYDATYPVPDQDNDGMPDFYELLVGTDPNDLTDAIKDTDGDGLSNFEEYELLSNPVNSDTDGDSIPDGYELAYGLDMLSGADASLDLDGDGLTNLEEYQAGSAPNVAPSIPTGPVERQVTLSWDIPTQRQDGSLLSQSDIKGYNIYTGTSPSELSLSGTATGSTQTNFSETLPPDGEYYFAISTVTTDDVEGPKSTVISLSGAGSAQLDTDGDGLTDAQEAQLLSDPTKADTDGDGLPDGYEVAYGMDLLSAADANADFDGDGLTNLAEYQQGSEPNNPESGPVVPIQKVVTLSWEIPTQRQDGSLLDLSEIETYQIYSGSDSNDLKAVATVDDPTQKSFSQTLSEGTYYYGISTVTSDGQEGPMSELITLTVN